MVFNLFNITKNLPSEFFWDSIPHYCSKIIWDWPRYNPWKLGNSQVFSNIEYVFGHPLRVYYWRAQNAQGTKTRPTKAVCYSQKFRNRGLDIVSVDISPRAIVEKEVKLKAWDRRQSPVEWEVFPSAGLAGWATGLSRGRGRTDAWTHGRTVNLLNLQDFVPPPKTERKRNKIEEKGLEQ